MAPPSAMPHDRAPDVTGDLERRASLQPGEVLMHVDTGANGTVTCMSGELHNITPARVHCNTAKVGESDLCNVLGTLVVSFISADRTVQVDFTLPHTVEMPTYRRRSLSCHALKRLGYETDHRLRSAGNVLWIRMPNGKEHIFKLLTIDEADYLIVKVFHPMVERSISAIDIAKTMQAQSLYHLIHLRLGCPGDVLWNYC